MTAWSGTLPPLLSADVPSAAEWKQILDALHGLTDAMSSYPVAWTSTGSAPAIGNGYLYGEYARAGKLAYGRISLTLGSTTTIGTGEYRWNLPVPGGGGLANGILSSGHLIDFSVGPTASRDCVLRNAGANLFYATSSVGVVGAASPYALAVSDNMELSFFYPAD